MLELGEQVVVSAGVSEAGHVGRIGGVMCWCECDRWWWVVG